MLINKDTELKRPIAIHKKCKKCGIIHCMVPVGAQAQMDFEGHMVMGWMWQCVCNDTLYFPIEKPYEVA